MVCRDAKWILSNKNNENPPNIIVGTLKDRSQFADLIGSCII